MFGARGLAASNSSIAFVSKACVEKGNHLKYALKKSVLPVSNTREIGKKDMLFNATTPKIEVDPETYKVTVDGVHATCAPASVLPLAQRYFLF